MILPIMKWGVSLPERRANITSKADCIRCLRKLHQPWIEIYPKLRIQKQMALRLVRGSLPVLGGKGSLKYIRARNRAKMGIKSEAQLAIENKQQAKSEFIKIRDSFRREAAQLRKRHFKPWKDASLISYYKNHEESKKKAAIRARRKYWANRNNPTFRLKRALRNTINRLFRGKLKRRKAKATANYLGTTIDDARLFIERRFIRGMTWSNHGKIWEIDHVIPLSKFDLSDERQLLQATHFTNLQPLWKRDNRRKGDVLQRHETPALL